ncbi:MATE family efflux transporter [Nostocoides sp. F2B08]|uniref:MATE family efflux transporter n=1 Tax=Nostocoides sp. F2B08 TaxID=2653936 RepID=UPI0012630C37|nr:MATE family efflux transporter [Tetrasphaera sp. F2B08]KAB7745473.1 MATE family efflux transporter [Tetrasphaera sp. F2B08]
MSEGTRRLPRLPPRRSPRAPDEQQRNRAESREVLRLAVPAFLALVAEPLFLLADSAIVGHLGTPQLAGLGVASAILLTAANVFVFLAYGTTATVARHLGAGSRPNAVAAGIDGAWLAIALGTVTGVIVALTAEPLCGVFGASEEAIGYAVTYLRISAIGIPFMLVVLAVTGVLRGLQDTKTPLIASVFGFGLNIVLNFWFVYGLDMGIAGAAWGTVISQFLMASGLVFMLLREARRLHTPLRAHPARVLVAARDGIPLLVRTLALRAILLTTMWTAASLGDVPLAAHQIAATIWSFLVFALDAIAIAAQALTGKSLGAGDTVATRRSTNLMVRWGIWSGVVAGLALLLVLRWLPQLFTNDQDVQRVLASALLIVALSQPLSGYVFVIDGVLIGAGDARWLAKAMVVNFMLYLPLIFGVYALGPWLLSTEPPVRGMRHAMLWLWLAFTGFMAIRAVLLGMRVRTDRWMVTGAPR